MPTLETSQADATPKAIASTPATLRSSRAFVRWYRGRPAVGSTLIAIGGVEMFFSGQLDLGNIHVQVGIEGLQATILPIVLLLLAVLSLLMPVHRIFYGVITLALSVYSLVGLNLGGFFIGMLLGTIGGVMVVSWAPRPDVPTKRATNAERR